MGKEWHWGSRSTKKRGGGGGGGGGGSGATTTSCGGGGDKENSATTTPSGCMSAVLQFFDFHQFQFPLHHPQPPLNPHYSFLPEDPTLLKGVEAPRNSLESEEEKSSLSSVSKEEDNLNFPVGIQIKTSAETKLKLKVGGATNDVSSESSYSPATSKTPNLVARLMGLDLLPDYSPSPSSSSSSHQPTQFPLAKSHFHHLIQPQNSKRQRLHHHHHHRCFLDNDVPGTRSLPETPRISAARRSDVDHHRLSLQINKENIGTSEEMDLSGIWRRRKEMMKQENESSSPNYYARQIMKQVKESVGRRVGLDITNTVKFRDHDHDHDHPPPNKSKKIHKVYSKNGDEFSPSCSPRLRFLETKTKPVSPSSTKDQKPHSPLSSSSSSSSSSNIDNHSQPKIPSKPNLQPVQNQQPPPMKKCKKPTRENFRARLKSSPKTSDTIRNKKEEPFVRPSTAKNSNHSDKKCKKTPLSTNLLSISSVPFKKEPSPPTTKIHQKQVHEIQSSSKCSSSLSSCRTSKYKEEAEATVATARNMLAAQEDGSEEKAMTTTTTTTIQVQGAAEFQYISRILKRTGIDRDTTISSTRFLSPFLSPSLPLLQPSIFHQLEEEKSHPTNPMLIFHLVNEFLPEILKPQFKNCQEMSGGELHKKLCERITRIRCRNCEVLEDIDKMVDEDLPEWKLRRVYVEEEGEEMVAEIEREILEELVAETTVDYGVGPCPVQKRRE